MDVSALWQMDAALFRPDRLLGRAGLRGSWGATRGAAASSWLLGGKQCSRLEGRVWAIVTSVYGCFFFFLVPARAVRTWKYGAFFLYDLVSGSLFLGVWVLLVEYGIGFYER